jgi:hypothetical protein
VQSEANSFLIIQDSNNSNKVQVVKVTKISPGRVDGLELLLLMKQGGDEGDKYDAFSEPLPSSKLGSAYFNLRISNYGTIQTIGTATTLNICLKIYIGCLECMHLHCGRPGICFGEE